MDARRRGHTFAAPRHLDRPKQWVHMPWLLLGMLFMTALLISSHRLSPSGTPAGDPPADDTSQVEPISGHP